MDEPATQMRPLQLQAGPLGETPSSNSHNQQQEENMEEPTDETEETDHMLQSENLMEAAQSQEISDAETNHPTPDETKAVAEQESGETSYTVWFTVGAAVACIAAVALYKTFANR